MKRVQEDLGNEPIIVMEDHYYRRLNENELSKVPTLREFLQDLETICRKHNVHISLANIKTWPGVFDIGDFNWWVTNGDYVNSLHVSFGGEGG